MSRTSAWNWVWVLATILGLVSVPQASRAAPVLVVNGSGILTGVQDVVVGISSYNVTFADGTCASVYGVCDSAHFTFATTADATDASTALLAAIESPTDFDETKIFGCGNSFECEIFTAESVDGVGFVHGGEVIDYTPAGTAAFGLPDFAGFGQGDGSGADTSTSDAFVYAVWSSAASTGSVPEPATDTMLGLGLLTLVFVRRRHKANIETS